MRHRQLIAVGILLLLISAPLSAAKKDADQKEIELGREASAQIEKQYKLVEDPAALERVNRIIQQIGPLTERPQLRYSVKILKDKSINAVSLPGGFIYITQGALSAAESDDEVAAILAHEAAHIALKHAVQLRREDTRTTTRAGLAVLAAVLAGKNVDTGQMVMAAALIKEAVLNGYGRKFEMQADQRGLTYLVKSPYQPVAMLTVLSGLARMETEQPEFDPGVMQTHPFARERVEIIRQQMARMGLPTNPRQVTRSLEAAAQVSKRGDAEIAQLTLMGEVVFEAGVPVGGLSPLQRCRQAAESLNQLLRANIQSFEITLTSDQGATYLAARQRRFLAIYPQDAAFYSTTVTYLADLARKKVQMALWKETVDRGY